jgi:hypothetical protein
MNKGFAIRPNSHNGFQIPVNTIFNFNEINNDSVIVHQNGYLFFRPLSSFVANSTKLSYRNYIGSVKGIISAFGISLSTRYNYPNFSM